MHISFGRTGGTLNRVSFFPSRLHFQCILCIYSLSWNQEYDPGWLRFRGPKLLPPGLKAAGRHVCLASTVFAHLNVNVFAAGHMFSRALRTLLLPVVFRQPN